MEEQRETHSDPLKHTHAHKVMHCFDLIPSGVCFHVSVEMKSDLYFSAWKCQDICLNCAVCFSRVSTSPLLTLCGINLCIESK